MALWYQSCPCPDGGDAECPGQDLGQAVVVRAGGIGPDEPHVPDLPRDDQAGLLGTLYLAVVAAVAVTVAIP